MAEAKIGVITGLGKKSNWPGMSTNRGHPAQTLPALAGWNSEEILAAKEIRQVIHTDAAASPKPPTQREGTKRAMLIAMLQAPTGATMGKIISATGWQAHTARGAMSGALGKKLGLVVISAKAAERGRVYRIEQPAH